MKSEIICVGTEILLGDIVNTNSQYISKNLNELGLSVLYHTVTGDNPLRLKEAFKQAFDRSDIIIATGGLGPTQDDLTKETAAELMGVELETNDEWMQKLQTMFGDRMTPNNIKQAYVPRGAIMLKNDNGTAPGIIIETEDKLKAIILLPGPPKEMVPMFDKQVLPYLMKKSGKSFYSRYYMITGYGESALEYKLIDIIDKQTNPTIATYAKENGVLLRVTANAKNKEEADVLIDKYEEIINSRVGDGIFANEDVSLSKVMIDLLKKNNLKLAVAESCTGGVITSSITENPGASEVLYGGFVTYSNEAKMKVLGVKKETLDAFGAVSEQTAVEMVQGLILLSGADAAVAVTGIAGPGGGSEEKPVGLAYISIYFKGEITTKKVNYAFRRKMHQIRVGNEALNMLRHKILEN
jgi:nicotinamide-nucleotide amidase